MPGDLIAQSVERAAQLMGLVSRLTRSRWARRLYAAVIVLALGILGLTVWRSWERLSEYSWQWSWRSLALSFVGYTLSLITAVSGWSRIMSSLGTGLSFRQHWKVYTFTNIAKRLPSAIWYASGRLLMYEQLGVSKSLTSLSVAIDLVMIIYTGAISTVLLSLLRGRTWQWAEQVWAYVALLLCLVVIVRPQWTIELLSKARQRTGRQPIEARLRLRDTLGWLPVYTATWLAGGLMLYGLIGALYPVGLGQLVEVLYAWALSGVVSTVLTSVLPLSIGPRELTLIALLSQSMPVPVAAAVALLSRAWMGINQLVWFGISCLL
jgi:uncharacterized membrane protein YbhN (UPF0104 family)